MSDRIRVSVRNLVEFILRSGDIDNRHGTYADKDAMQIGSRIHRKIQRQMGAGYHAEYSLKIEIPMDQIILSVEGRADGIIMEEDKVTIDEIKGVFLDVSYLKEAIFIHKAQAMCYGYIYAKQNGLDEIGIQMTYCNMETELIKRFHEVIAFTELESWFKELVEKYKKWMVFQAEWKKSRKASIQNIDFPFSYRDGQKDLATYVYRTIYHKKKMFIQAPTGVGKTITTIFPAVKAVGEELAEKVFYLTAKTVTRTVAMESFQVLRTQNLRFKVIAITAKEKLCMLDEMECNPDSCPYAKGHYDRINNAVFDMLQNDDVFDRDSILEGAEKFMVCPYEFCLDISSWCDGIVCDYNYVFDPVVHLKRFFSEGVKGEYIFLIDEAHNLVERAREMYSAQLYKEQFLEIKRMVKNRHLKLIKRLETCNKFLLERKRECENYELQPDVGQFYLYLLNLSCELELVLENEDQDDIRKAVLEFFLEVRNFLYIYELCDEHYEVYTELEESGNFKIRLFCIDPSQNLQEYLNKGNSTIYFSATLLPMPYYKELLSNEDDDYAVYAESPFTDDQKLLLIGQDVSSKYTRRNQREYEKIAQYLKKTVDGREGNYMAFFPSYRMLEDVKLCFESIAGSEVTCIEQVSNMNEIEREEFIKTFENNKEGTLLGFCVMGGVFGEGIDLKQDSLIGVIIVGTGLPQICNEREILKNYYLKREMDGFGYAYLYPGMNKVLQSAGRVIRTDEDRGVILLLDERFNQYQYKNLFPKEWTMHSSCNLNNITGYLDAFWGE